MFCYLLANSRPKLGLLIYNDDDQVLSHHENAPVEVLSKWHNAIALGVVCPPMVFVALEKDSVEIYEGVLERSEDSCSFTGADLSGTLDFSGFDKENENLCTLLISGGRELHQLKKNSEKYTVEEATKTNFTAGLSCCHHWIASLAVKRTFITHACVRLVTSGTQAIKKLMLKGGGKQPASSSTYSSWAMWYPSPRPQSLKKWLEYLSRSTDYNVDHIMSLSPAHEGFYRFRIKNLPRNQVSVIFDDATEDYEATQSPAYFLLSGDENRGYIQITMSMYLRSPVESAQVLDVFGTGFFGTKETIMPLILPLSAILIDGGYGPLCTVCPTYSTDAFEREARKAPSGRRQHLTKLARQSESEQYSVKLGDFYTGLAEHASSDIVQTESQAQDAGDQDIDQVEVEPKAPEPSQPVLPSSPKTGSARAKNITKRKRDRDQNDDDDNVKDKSSGSEGWQPEGDGKRKKQRTKAMKRSKRAVAKKDYGEAGDTETDELDKEIEKLG